MESRLHLLLQGVTTQGLGAPGEAPLASPELDTDLVDAIARAVYYASPETSGMAPPVCWSLVPVGEEHWSLSRSIRAPGKPVRSISAVFPRTADLVGTAQLLDLADDDTLFPGALDRAPEGPLARPLPPSRTRLSEAFGALLQFVRSDRAVLADLVAAMSSLGDRSGPLRGVVLTLPAASFGDARNLLAVLLGLAASVPRRARGALGLTTYQDSPSPRPLALMAIPESHRCIPRLQRSSGHLVYPGPTREARSLLPRVQEYGGMVAELLVSGRFEEVQALAATFDLHGATAPRHAQREAEEQAALLRLAQNASVTRLLAWMDSHTVPEDHEKRRLLFDAIGRSLGHEARNEKHGAGAQLLRVLGVRWSDSDWTGALADQIRAPLVAFLRSWHEAAGWESIVNLFGRLTSAAPWVRELLAEATAEAVAALAEGPTEDVEEVLATLETQFDALPRALPPVRYLRWRLRHIGDTDGRVRAYVLRMLSTSGGQEPLVELLKSFESPRRPSFSALLETSLGALTEQSEALACEVIKSLVEHFGEEGAGLEILDLAMTYLARAGVEDAIVRLTTSLLLPLGGLATARRALQSRVLRLAVLNAPLERWHAETDALIAAGEDRTTELANVRQLWVESLSVGGRIGSRGVAAVLRAIHDRIPDLALDPSPHLVLSRTGGPEVCAELAFDDIRLLTARVGDDEVRRFLTGLLVALERQSPDAWHWQQALVETGRRALESEVTRATYLWWLWSAGREAGFAELAAHAARVLVLDNLVHALPDARFELLCRLLPSETSFSRERLVVAAVEGILYAWSARPGRALTPDLFRHFTPQADSLSRGTYARVVHRFVEACLLLRESSAEELRLLLDRVYVPRHWEVLANVIQETASLRPRLRLHLTSLRRTTLGRRLPPQLLGAFDPPRTSGRGTFLE